MKYRPDKSSCVYGAGILIKHTTAMQVEMEGVRQAQDIEYIHRMRVATRRLRTALGIFPGCLPAKKLAGWQKEIRRITKALGAARDSDVQIEMLQKMIKSQPQAVYRPGLRRLLLRISQNRQSLQQDVIRALERVEKSQVLAGIQTALAPLCQQQGEVFLYSPALYQLAADNILDGLEEVLLYEDAVQHPERVAELHAMRIAAKHLRYSLEAFAALYPDELKTFINTMRKIQDSLGEIHDCDVWEQYLPQFEEEERARVLAYYGYPRPANRLIPGIEYFRQNRRELRQATYQDFLGDWKKLIAKDLWGNLRRVVEAPLYLPPDLPPAEAEASIPTELEEPVDLE